MEALKVLLADVVTSEGKELLINDISRAFFYAPAIRPVFVKIPPEAQKPGDEGMCWELCMSRYGTRDAATNWHAKYSGHLRGIGFQQAKI